MTETTSKIHDYVGMTINYTEKYKVKFSMIDYLEEIITNSPEEFIGKAITLTGNHLFTVDEDAEKLNEEDRKTLHHYVLNNSTECAVPIALYRIFTYFRIDLWHVLYLE